MHNLNHQTQSANNQPLHPKPQTRSQFKDSPSPKINHHGLNQFSHQLNPGGASTITTTAVASAIPCSPLQQINKTSNPNNLLGLTTKSKQPLPITIFHCNSQIHGRQSTNKPPASNPKPPSILAAQPRRARDHCPSATPRHHEAATIKAQSDPLKPCATINAAMSFTRPRGSRLSLP